MPDQIRELRVAYSLAGRNVREQRSVTIQYLRPSAVTPAKVKDMHQAVVDALKTVLPPQVQILSQRSSEVLRGKGAHITKGKFISSKFRATGTLPNNTNKDLAVTSFVAVWGKSADAEGTTGEMSLRGAFLDGDVISTNGIPSLKVGFVSTAFTALGDLLLAAFVDNGMKMVLPAAPADNFITGAREVKDFDFQGVGELQRNSRKRSAAQVKSDYVDSTLNRIAQTIYDATHNSDGTLNPLTLAIITAIAGELIPLVEAVGFTYLASRGLNRLIPVEIITKVGELMAAV